MKRLLVSVNTCNTHNFGIQDHPSDTSAVKAYCLTATGYPTSDGLTHRTYIMYIEDAESERAGIKDMQCIGCAMRQRDRHGKDEGRAQCLEIREGGKANSLTTVNKDSMVMQYDTDQ